MITYWKKLYIYIHNTILVVHKNIWKRSYQNRDQQLSQYFRNLRLPQIREGYKFVFRCVLDTTCKCIQYVYSFYNHLDGGIWATKLLISSVMSHDSPFSYMLSFLRWHFAKSKGSGFKPLAASFDCWPWLHVSRNSIVRSKLIELRLHAWNRRIKAASLGFKYLKYLTGNFAAPPSMSSSLKKDHASLASPNVFYKYWRKRQNWWHVHSA